MKRHVNPLMLVIPLLVALLSGAMFTSCGSGGGTSDGLLCSGCGDSDGPCLPLQLDRGTHELCPSPDPASTASPPPPVCTIPLTCLRRLGSAQRVCFPISTDRDFECDGARAGATPTPTGTPTVSATPTLSAAPSLTPSATSQTPNPTPTVSAAVTTTPSPAPSSESVSIEIDASTEGVTASQIQLMIAYPAAKGSFDTSSCVASSFDDEETEPTVTPMVGSGTLTLTIARGVPMELPVDVECEFAEPNGDELVDGEITANVVSPAGLTATVTL